MKSVAAEFDGNGLFLERDGGGAPNEGGIARKNLDKHVGINGPHRGNSASRSR